MVVGRLIRDVLARLWQTIASPSTPPPFGALRVDCARCGAPKGSMKGLFCAACYAWVEDLLTRGRVDG